MYFKYLLPFPLPSQKGNGKEFEIESLNMINYSMWKRKMYHQVKKEVQKIYDTMFKETNDKV